MTDALAILARIEHDLAELRALLGQPATEAVISRPEELLAPCQLADRLGISESQVRRLCQQGHAAGIEGIVRDGSRWRATIAAMRVMRV